MNAPYIKKPVLILSSPQIKEMEAKLRWLKTMCGLSFSGNSDWRAKQSIQRQTEALELKIGQEKKRLQDEYDKAVEDYNMQIQELKVAEEKFKDRNPIQDISLSSEFIGESEPSNGNVVDPIRSLDL